MIDQNSRPDPGREVKIIDSPDSNTTYICKAKLGALSSAAVWQIQKLTVSGTATTFRWADGDDNYDNVADNRTSLSYS